MQFSEFILANVRLYALRHDKSLSTHAVANFTRSELATALRKVPGLQYCHHLCILHPAGTCPCLNWGMHAAIRMPTWLILFCMDAGKSCSCGLHLCYVRDWVSAAPLLDKPAHSRVG